MLPQHIHATCTNKIAYRVPHTMCYVLHGLLSCGVRKHFSLMGAMQRSSVEFQAVSSEVSCGLLPENAELYVLVAVIG